MRSLLSALYHHNRIVFDLHDSHVLLAGESAALINRFYSITVIIMSVSFGSRIQFEQVDLVVAENR